MKKLILATSVAMLCACASNDKAPQSNQQTNAPVVAKTAEKAPVSKSSDAKKQQVSLNVASAPLSAIVVSSDIPYGNENRIANNVVDECSELGKQFSNSFVKYAKEQKIDVVQTEQALPEKGRVIKLFIDDVYSGGNAFIGHRKSATVRAELVFDGKVVATTSKTRNSAGGVFGGFKGSCSVLEHTVNTLGSDVAKWLKQETVL
jgi:hypothetical protein